MQIVILVPNLNPTADGAGWHVHDLRRAAAARGHTAELAAWEALSAALGTDAAEVRASDVVLDAADTVLMRTMPAGSLEQVIFRMDVLHRLRSLGVPVINPPRAMEAAIDKYLCLARVQRAGLPTPTTYACQSAVDAMRAFAALGGDAVMKPLFGSMGRGVELLDDEAVAAAAFADAERAGRVIYLQQMLSQRGEDVRLFVLGGEVIAAMRRQSACGDWRSNIALGGRGAAMCVDPMLGELAARAAEACGAAVAGVDLLIDDAGRPFVIEVNAVPGWRELSRVTGVDIAAEVVRYVERVHESGAGRHVA